MCKKLFFSFNYQQKSEILFFKFFFVVIVTPWALYQRTRYFLAQLFITYDSSQMARVSKMNTPHWILGLVLQE